MFKSILKYTAILLSFALLFYIILILFYPINYIKTVDENNVLPSITLNGHKFHSETFGDPSNPIIIALHGGPGADYRYMIALKDLSSKYYIVMYDQRMTGLSSRNTDQEITIQLFLDDLDGFIDHYSKGKLVNIVGHSWGAMLASGYIAQHPDKVNKIVMTEPGILRTDLAGPFLNQEGASLVFGDWVKFVAILLNQWRVDTDTDEHARKDFVMSSVALHFAAKEYGNRDDLGWRMGAHSQDVTEGRSMRDPEYLASLDFLSGVEKFSRAVLFLTSENNKVYGADYQKGFLKFYQHAQQLIVKNSGHSIYLDQPKQSIQMIDAFLKK